MYLYINTSQSEKIVLALMNKKGEILKLKSIQAKYKQSERLLKEIDKILNVSVGTPQRAVLGLENLKGVLVVVGPGGFTALRIGVATANTLAWSLDIPILGMENKNNLDDKKLIDKNFKKILKLKKFNSANVAGRQVLPKYGKQPNITISKK